jgi:hypothetical protein
MKHKHPYGMFPGIFSTLDKYQRSITSEYKKLTGKFPPWLNAFGEFVSIEPSMHWSKFSMTLPNGIVFRGVPDTMLRRTDGSLFILDEKTAKPKEAGHKLELLYDVQLNGYAKIANALGLGPVSGLGIVYNVPVQLGDEFGVDEAVRGNGYVMSFQPTLRHVELDLEGLEVLITRASGIVLDQFCPPRILDCKNCALIDKQAELANFSNGKSVGVEIVEG